MAVMTSEQSEGVTFEQKTQPVPSSDKMALDLDINGTSNRDETNLELAPSDPPLNQNLSTSPSNELTSSTTEVNGSFNTDAFSSNNTVATSASDHPIDTLADESSSAPAVDLSFSDIPDTNATTDQQESSDLFGTVDSLVDAAVEDHQGISTVPPVVEAPESDLRDTSLPSHPSIDSVEADKSTIQDADLPLRLTDDALATEDTADSIESTNHKLDSSLTAKDTDMSEAPPAVPKMSREREDDHEDEPSAKRPKTEDTATEANIIVGDVPITNQNGDSTATKVEDPPITPFQSKEIIRVLKGVLRTQAGKNFRAPVDQLWPSFAEAYAAKVPNQIDLGAIEKKVKDNVYTSYKNFKADITLLYTNAALFNGVDHIITQAAKDVRESILTKTSNLPSDAPQAPKQAKKAAVKRSTPTAESVPKAASTARRGSRSGVPGTAPKTETFALDPSGVPLIRRDSTKLDGGRPKREIHPPKNKDLPYNSVRPKSKKNATELKFCETVLAELKKPKYHAFSAPFMFPVDPVALGVPGYFNIIKSPMDLSTVSSRLDSGFYQKAKDFEADVRLILANCFKFNPLGNPVHDMGKQMEELFNGQWEKKQQWISDHTPAALSPSSTMDTEDEDSEEEPEPEPAASTGTSAYAARLIDEQQKLIALMTQKNADPSMVSMQQDIVQMIQKKVNEEAQAAAPKKGAKKAKPAASKPAKKNTVVKKAPTTSSGKKSSSRPRYMGTIEKEVVSAGIGLLPEATQDRVMELIKGDAPDVQADDDGSLELDIESLTEPSLWEIYDMILKYLPDVDRSIRKQKDQERVRSRALAQPKQKKKHKPMTKNEQERKIEHLKNAVQEFERHGSGSQEPVLPTVEQRDETSGDETSDSEEE